MGVREDRSEPEASELQGSFRTGRLYESTERSLGPPGVRETTFSPVQTALVPLGSFFQSTVGMKPRGGGRVFGALEALRLAHPSAPRVPASPVPGPLHLPLRASPCLPGPFGCFFVTLRLDSFHGSQLSPLDAFLCPPFVCTCHHGQPGLSA